MTSIILSSMLPISTPMQRLVFPQRRWVCKDGNPSCTTGKDSTKTILQCKLSAFQWTKCLQIASKKTKFILSQQQKLPRPNGPTQPWSTSLSAIVDKGLEIKLIENTTCVYKDGQLVIPKPLQVCAVKWFMITYCTLDTQILKRQWVPQCTGKVCVSPSGQ